MNEFTPLPRDFFAPSARRVARALLGHWLVRQTAAGPCGGPIVETEAYLRDDPACHAARGLTRRNRVMFGPPGHGYVYFIYGMHYCVNAVCGPPGIGEAVLIRAIEPAWGEEQMRRRRAGIDRRRDLTNGPAKLCEALNIRGRLNGVDFCNGDAPLFIARNPAVAKFRATQGRVVTATRIGITQAAHLPLRFYLARSEFVSRNK
jgi:DNA-3-methyladenine glycosylase